MTSRARFGRTGLAVSTLSFGTGYLSGPVSAGARLLTRAYELGVTFWDTSDDYGTHPHVARALREVGREGVVVATKTYASTTLILTRRARTLGSVLADAGPSQPDRSVTMGVRATGKRNQPRTIRVDKVERMQADKVDRARLERVTPPTPVRKAITPRSHR